MKKHNASNERIKRQYITYLIEAKRLSEKSIDIISKALNRFETYTKFQDFKQYHIQQAIGFKKWLAKQTNERTGDVLSYSTQLSTLTAMKNFFFWLAGQPGFKSRFSYSDSDYFSFSEKNIKPVKGFSDPHVPTLEQIEFVINNMPDQTDIEKRDKAIIAFILLTGVRDGALISLKLKHLDIKSGVLIQDAKEVSTKFQKSFKTQFFPISENAKTIIENWFNYLTKEKLFALEDPLFPKTSIAQGAHKKFQAIGLDRTHWTTSAPIRQIFQKAFVQAELPYFNPHSFRKTLAQLGQKLCKTPEEFKAWSQNLGHEKVETTLSSYGTVSFKRQSDLIKNINQNREEENELAHFIAGAVQQYKSRGTA